MNFKWHDKSGQQKPIIAQFLRQIPGLKSEIWGCWLLKYGRSQEENLFIFPNVISEKSKTRSISSASRLRAAILAGQETNFPNRQEGNNPFQQDKSALEKGYHSVFFPSSLCQMGDFISDSLLLSPSLNTECAWTS